MPEDQDPQETQEWRDALDSVVDFDGPDRAAFLLKELYEEARRHAVVVPYSANTAYINTIPVDKQPPHPGDLALEHIIRSLNRWNAVATVLRANKTSSELGGHIASFQSSATLYDTGFNHFWHAPSAGHGGDLLFVQGHVAARHLRACVPRGPDHRGAAPQVPPGGRGRRALVVPAPVADAGVLAVPHGVDGPGSDHVDLPGPLPQVPARAQPGRHGGPARVGVPRRRRDGRARVARRDLAGRAGEAGQPDLGHQLQPAAPRRPGARQRKDHPGAGGDLPRRRLERHQGHLGVRLGPAAGRRQVRPAAQAHGGVRRRRVPGLQVQERRLRPRALLRQVPGAAGPGQGHDGRPDLGAEPRRARPVEGLHRVQGGRRQRRHADGDPRQDRQGLRDG